MNGVIMPNQLKRVSYSGMSQYIQCPSQWAYYYIENNPRQDTVFTLFGRIVHEVFEHLTNNPSSRTKEQAIALFSAYWQEYQLTDVSFFTRGLEMMDAYFERPNAFELPIIGVEVQFGYDEKTDSGTPMYIGDVPVLGFIDRIDQVDAESIIVRDYKTNIVPFTGEEVENHLQMTMYDIVVRKLYPWVKNVTLILDMPGYGEFKTSRTEEKRKEVENYINNVWQQMLYDKEFKPKLNQYCAYCPKRGACDLYSQSLLMKVAIANPDDAVGLWAEREQLSHQKKIIDKRLDEIDVAIKSLMVANAQRNMVVGDSEFYFTQQRRYSFDSGDIIRLLNKHGLGEIFHDLISFQKGKLEKHPLAKGNKSLFKELDECAKVAFTNPSINCRKINEVPLDE